MKIVNTREREKITYIDIEHSNGERVTLEIFKDHDVIRVNSGFGNPSIRPRTSNEFDITFEDR